MAPPDEELRGLLERLAKLRDVGALSEADYDWVNRAVRYLPFVWAQGMEASKLTSAVYKARQLWDEGDEAGAHRTLGLTGERGRPGPSDREVVELLWAATERGIPGYVNPRELQRVGNPVLGATFTAEQTRAVYIPLEGDEPFDVIQRSLGLKPLRQLTLAEALTFLERAFGWEAERGRRQVEEARARLAKSDDPADRELAARCPALSYPERQKAVPDKSPRKRE